MTFIRPALCSISVLALAAVFFLCAEGRADDAPMPQTPTTQQQEASSDSIAGNYLAARYAQRRQDWRTAEKFMSRVLEKDKANTPLKQRTFLLALGSGDAEQARLHAQEILAGKERSELALIFMATDSLAAERYDDALGYLGRLGNEGFGQYTKPLLTAWSLVGAGRTAEALALLEKDNAPESSDPAFSLHAGMIHDYAGQTKKALTSYRRAVNSQMSLHSAMVVEAFLAANGEPKLAAMIKDGIRKIYPGDTLPATDPALSRVRRPADGAAMALMDLATLLYEKNAYDSALIYARMVEHLDRNSPFIKLMMGDIMDFYNHPAEAVGYYQSIPEGSPLFWAARLRQIDTLEESGRMDEAVALLTDMGKNPATRTDALVYLGDVYRRHQAYDRAVEAYTQALQSIGTPTEKHWPLMYARGMALERTNRWDLAEKDLMQALEFQPDNPLILNYLGYSWADQGKNLDRALEMIKKAVMLRPDDGYILDSYGWALYRTGNFKDGALWLERAVGRAPDDAVINDHLGDAYWRAGRHSEAKFQWKRAHDLAEDPALKTKIARKIETGVEDPEIQRKADSGWAQPQ